MSDSKRQTFRAVLETREIGPRFVIARVPVDLKKAWPAWKTRRVRGEINGFAFKTSLFPGSQGSGFMFLVNRRMQAGAKVGPGSEARICLEPDLEEQVVQIPAELVRVLKGDRALKKWFDRLSPSMQKGIGGFVDHAKSAQTRIKRAESIAETLMLAMEGEVEPPPILRAAFQRQPTARAGWDAMTPTQRKHHLLGIFYAQTVEGRERRAAKAIEDCLRVAKRKRKATS